MNAEAVFRIREAAPEECSEAAFLLNALGQNGPLPMHEVVVSAVRKAVSAATIIFATSSTMLVFFISLGYLIV